MRSIFKKISTGIIIFTAALYGQLAVAASVIPNINSRLSTTGANAGLDTVNLREAIALIIKSLLGFLGSVFVILIIYAGFIWMTSGGSSEKIDRARKILTSSTVGLLIVILAYAITVFVFSVIGDAVTGQGSVPPNPNPGP